MTDDRRLGLVCLAGSLGHTWRLHRAFRALRFEPSPFRVGIHLQEFQERLQSKFGLSDPEASMDVEVVRARATLCVPDEVDMPSLLDKDDLPILGTAYAAVADCIVAGDRELQLLERFRGIPILAPKDFWEFERNG